MEEVIKNKEVLSVDAPEESLAGVAGVPAVDAPAVDAVDAVDAALDAPGMDAEQGVPDKAVTGVSVESVEKNAAVIEAVDAAIDGSVGAIAAAVAVAEPVGYSTRSKESFLKQKQDNVKIHPRLKPVAFKRHEYQQSGKLPLKNQISTSKDITFYNSEDYPINKRGFKYKPCIPSEALSANLYSTTEIPPYRVRPSYFDRLSGIIFNEDMDCVSTTEGWRSIRTNLGVSEGCYYMEFEILNANNGEDRSHVRIGLARKEASLEAPVGFDGYGYAIRDVNGQKVTLSRPKDFMEGGDGFRNGDVIGMLIALPSAEVQESDMKDWYAKRAAASAQAAASVSSPSPGAAASGTSSHAKKKRKTKSESDSSDGSLSATIQSHNNIVRDQIPIKYKSSLYYEQYEYTSTKKWTIFLTQSLCLEKEQYWRKLKLMTMTYQTNFQQFQIRKSLFLKTEKKLELCSKIYTPSYQPLQLLP